MSIIATFSPDRHLLPAANLSISPGGQQGSDEWRQCYLPHITYPDFLLTSHYLDVCVRVSREGNSLMTRLLGGVILAQAVKVYLRIGPKIPRSCEVPRDPGPYPAHHPP